MAYYALIGGRSPEYLIDFSLEEKIFQRLGLKNPKILFFPFACKKDREQSIIKFKRLTQETGYQISFLRDLTDRSVVLKSIRKASFLRGVGWETNTPIRIEILYITIRW